MNHGSMAKMTNDAPNRIVENITTADEKNLDDMEDISNDVIVNEEHRSAVENLWRGIVELPSNWSDMTMRQQRDWVFIQINQHMTNLPKSLHFLIVGWTIRGDRGRSVSAAKPEWYDHEKFLRGQRFAMNNLTGVFLAELVSLFALFSFENSLKPLIITGKSSDPYTAFKRYLSTANRVKNWYSSDPWTEGTPAYQDIQTVRRMHTVVRNKLINWSLEEMDKAAKIENIWDTARPELLEDFRGSCPAAMSGQCPYMFSKEDQYKRPKGMNQSEMAATQAGFVCFAILYPRHFGIHGASDEDLDAFCHVWRCVGYLLEMEDEFNFCNGTLEEIKQRSKDFCEYWVKPNLREITPEWEHMLRCLMKGLGYYIPWMEFKYGVLYFAEILNIPLPRLEASYGYMDWFRYKLLKITLRWTARLPLVPAAMNRGLLHCLKKGHIYTSKGLDNLKKHSSAISMSKGAEKTVAAQEIFAISKKWYKNVFIILPLTSLFLTAPILVATFTVKRLLISKTA